MQHNGLLDNNPVVFHSLAFGAARANEGGVVVVKCLEPTCADHVAKNGWGGCKQRWQLITLIKEKLD